MSRHQEYVRIVPEANTAILFIHGIVGTPDHFRKFIPLIPENYSIINLLLDGPGKTTDDFAKTSMKRWKSQVNGALTTLRQQHREIIIVAHSMGTLFAINAAIENPSDISQLFLMASPLRVHPKPSALTTSLKVLFQRVSPMDLRTLGATLAYGIKPDPRLWKYLPWIPRYVELLKEIYHTRGVIQKLSTPCTVYQSKKDELVAYSSVEILKKNPKIRIHTLPQSSHFYLTQEEEALVLNDFLSLCKL